MTQPQSPTTEEQIARLQLELQQALHDLHQRNDQSAGLDAARAELDAARAELANARDLATALELARQQIEALKAELDSFAAHINQIQGELAPNALPPATLRLWRLAAADNPDSPAAAALLSTISELEATRVQLARATASVFNSAPPAELDEPRAAAAAAAEVFNPDLERLSPAD
jgi:chromosome segregation ATPase